MWTLILFLWVGHKHQSFVFFEHSCSFPTRLGWSGSYQAELGPGGATSAPAALITSDRKR